MTRYSKSEQKLLSKFGANLKSCRLEKNLSQEKLAELAELHRTYIGSAERGERNISLINMHRIAKALKINTTKLTENLP